MQALILEIVTEACLAFRGVVPLHDFAGSCDKSATKFHAKCLESIALRVLTNMTAAATLDTAAADLVCLSELDGSACEGEHLGDVRLSFGERGDTAEAP